MSETYKTLDIDREEENRKQKTEKLVFVQTQ